MPRKKLDAIPKSVPNSKVKQPKRMWWSTTEIATFFGVSRTAVHAWIKKGVPVDGQTVKLRALNVGCAIRVKRRWLREFLRACNPDQPEPIAITRRGDQGHERAMASLRAIGVKV